MRDELGVEPSRSLRDQMALASGAPAIHDC